VPFEDTKAPEIQWSGIIPKKYEAGEEEWFDLVFDS
jgi:hypothetical protein